jgi:5-methylcytosine-specific restriction endonuclease McrA
VPSWRARYARTASPRTTVAQSDTSKAARYIPAAVRRAVHARDGSQCGFVDDEGRRCSEKWRLEFHHRRPYALGGDHSFGNLGLLCRQHNRLMAEHDYGRAALRGGPESASAGATAQLGAP